MKNNKKYLCFDCGEEMIKSGSYLECPFCGRTWRPNDEINESFEIYDENDDYKCYNKNDAFDNFQEDDNNWYSGYNQTYYERYQGTEYDLGEKWNYDEYPPENL